MSFKTNKLQGTENDKTCCTLKHNMSNIYTQVVMAYGWCKENQYVNLGGIQRRVTVFPAVLKSLERCAHCKNAHVLACDFED